MILWFKPCSSSWNTLTQNNKFFRFFFLLIISENFIKLHIKVTALRLSDFLSTPNNHLMSSAKNLIKHNEAEINPFMKYRDIFHQKNIPHSVVPNNTYNHYFATSFFVRSQKKLCQKKPLKTQNWTQLQRWSDKCQAEEHNLFLRPTVYALSSIVQHG